MDEVWIQSLHNLHCPSCDRRLVQRGRLHFHSELQSPVYVGDVGTLLCPQRHRLPDRQDLYDYRAERGYAPAAPVYEIAPPTA